MSEIKDLTRVEMIEDFNQKLLKACMPKSFSPNETKAQSDSSNEKEEMKRIYKARIQPFLVTTYS